MGNRSVQRIGVAFALAVVLMLTVSVGLAGCYDEASRAVVQCADEHVRCIGVIDALCRTDDRYCDDDAPFSNRQNALGACRDAYEDCYETATTTRTADRFTDAGTAR